MRVFRRGFVVIFTVLVLSITFILGGCGGGGSLNLVQPTEDLAKPGSLSGTVQSLFNGKIDFPLKATVTIAAVDANKQVIIGGFTANTLTTLTGTYQFTNVPKGFYKVSASIKAPTDPNIDLTNSLPSVTVLGGLPTLAVNLLIGRKLVTFSGLVTENNQAAVGAIVSIETSAEPFDQSATTSASIISTTTDNTGRYFLTVPDDNALFYIITAHSQTSQPVEAPEIDTPLTAEMLNVPPIVLAVKNASQLLTPLLDWESMTLPEASPSGLASAMLSRVGVARLLQQPPAKISALTLKASQLNATRAAATIGIVENDLSWGVPDPGSPDIRGYHIFRAASKAGPYVQIGTANDRFLTVFADNDPALTIDKSMHYMVTSFGKDGKNSTPSTPVTAKPLPVIQVVGPGTLDDTGEVLEGSAVLTWQTVPGAKGYIVIIYRQAPTLNTPPDQALSRKGLTPQDTSITLSETGTYWWSVSAYDVSTAGFNAAQAKAASFSAYRKIIIE